MTNWQLDDFDSKAVVFIGAGKGRAMAGVQQFLERHAKITSFTGIEKTDGVDGYDPTRTIFIKNEGIPGHELTVPYMTALQLFFRLVAQTGATTIGITGTKGKSTTTALTAHILEAAGKHVMLAGNIGLSPLLGLDDATSDSFFVLELSSYQLSDLTVSAHISACINLFNDHADWHGSLEQYWEAKHNIMRFAGPDDVFIYNPTFPALQQWAADASCQTKAINPDEPLDLSQAELFGDHNRLNALIAREIARCCGVDDATSFNAITSFQPLLHRMQFVATKQAVTYIDDAIGMTPESTVASLKAVTEKYGPVSCLLLGGQDRDYDFGELMATVAAAQIPHLVLFPNTVEKMRAALPAGYEPAIFETESMVEAVQHASQVASANSVVLLSTAAPSYLLWKDFEDKGERFQAAVLALA